MIPPALALIQGVRKRLYLFSKIQSVQLTPLSTHWAPRKKKGFNLFRTPCISHIHTQPCKMSDRAKYTKTVFSWAITQRVVVIPYRSLGDKTYRSHLRNDPEECSSHNHPCFSNVTSFPGEISNVLSRPIPNAIHCCHY